MRAKPPKDHDDVQPHVTAEQKSTPSATHQDTSSATESVYALEAYILRMRTASCRNIITLSPEIERLHLDEASIRAHMGNLGPNYSVINAMARLLPDQIQLIQEGIRSSSERLVAVHLGIPVDLATPMGTFKSTPIIFIIQATSAPTAVAASLSRPDVIIPGRGSFSPAEKCISLEEIRVADYAAGRRYGNDSCVVGSPQGEPSDIGGFLSGATVDGGNHGSGRATSDLSGSGAAVGDFVGSEHISSRGLFKKATSTASTEASGSTSHLWSMKNNSGDYSETLNGGTTPTQGLWAGPLNKSSKKSPFGWNPFDGASKSSENLFMSHP